MIIDRIDNIVNSIWIQSKKADFEVEFYAKENVIYPNEKSVPQALSSNTLLEIYDYIIDIFKKGK